MHRSFKGALAATSAGVLLLGGAGTLAYWSDDQNTGGGNITSGSITLGAPDCATAEGAHGWQIDGGEAFVPGTTDLVPGDSISKVCDMTLTLVGEHIGASLEMDAAGLTPAAGDTTTLDEELSAAAAFTVDGAEYTVPVDGAGTYDVRATVTVTFDGVAATNASQSGDVDLDAINLTATQAHDAS